MKNKVYIAGSLFKEADITQRITEEKTIKNLASDWNLYNPITADINDKSKLPTAKDILWGDFNQIKDSNLMLCALDDNDIGQAVEIGMAFGMNYFYDELSSLIETNNVSVDSIKQLLEKYPKKKIYAHHSDIRIKTGHKYQDNYLPYGINQFLIGCVEELGKIYPSYLLAIQKMVEENN